jgi:hypothetical protein
MSSIRHAVSVLTTLLAASVACGDGNGAPTGCGGLSACCANLAGPLAESCQTLLAANGVTDAACEEELRSLESAGSCGPVGASDGGSGNTWGGSGCYEVTGYGSTQICIFTADTTCATGFSSGSCPSANLDGCCVMTMTALGYTSTTGSCYYGYLVGNVGQESCVGASEAWSTSPP